MEPLNIIIKGPHNTGRTTMGVLFKMWLEENGYTDVKIADTEPLPPEQKEEFTVRWAKNRNRPVRIAIELEE